MESAQLLKAKEVLLLEDDLILGKRIEAYLTTLGMEVSRVTSCADAEKMHNIYLQTAYMRAHRRLRLRRRKR